MALKNHSKLKRTERQADIESNEVRKNAVVRASVELYNKQRSV